jgi:hypothetical protein
VSPPSLSCDWPHPHLLALTASGLALCSAIGRPHLILRRQPSPSPPHGVLTRTTMAMTGRSQRETIFLALLHRTAPQSAGFNKLLQWSRLQHRCLGIQEEPLRELEPPRTRMTLIHALLYIDKVLAIKLGMLTMSHVY